MEPAGIEGGMVVYDKIKIERRREMSRNRKNEEKKSNKKGKKKSEDEFRMKKLGTIMEYR